MEYNDLKWSSTTAFRDVGDTEYFSGAISDTPILDTLSSIFTYFGHDLDALCIKSDYVYDIIISMI